MVVNLPLQICRWVCESSVGYGIDTTLRAHIRMRLPPWWLCNLIGWGRHRPEVGYFLSSLPLFLYSVVYKKPVSVVAVLPRLVFYSEICVETPCVDSLSLAFLWMESEAGSWLEVSEGRGLSMNMCTFVFRGKQVSVKFLKLSWRFGESTEVKSHYNGRMIGILFYG